MDGLNGIIFDNFLLVAGIAVVGTLVVGVILMRNGNSTSRRRGRGPF